jgi:signal transduction histidine kinase
MAAGYALGRRCQPAALLGGLCLLAAAVASLLLRDPTLRRPFELVFPLVYFGGAIGLGRLVRSRERAADAALQSAHHEAQTRERMALSEERARIAREMHDVVAHSVSLLVLQAESAAAVMDDDPQRARTQLDRVAAGGRQALDELRRLLGVLRSTGDPADVGPQPGLVGLPELAQAAGATGPVVGLDVQRGLDALPPGLQLTAYRVVQGALTNAVRHGDARHVDVRVTCTGGRLLIEVVDDGTPAADRQRAGPGHGLVGMRERLRLYDGALEAGPRPTGGWRLEATAAVST